MELRPYLERLHADLTNVAAAAGADVAAAADRLLLALEPSVRIALMEALADAAAEITQELDRVAVEVRLRGSEPQFVVVPTGRRGTSVPPARTPPSRPRTPTSPRPASPCACPSG